MGLEAEDWTGVRLYAGHALPFVAVVVSALHHQRLLQFMRVEGLLQRLAHPHALQLLGHQVEFFDDVVVAARFGETALAVADAHVLLLAAGATDEFVLVEQGLHRLVLLLDHDALSAPGLDVEVQPRDVFGQLEHLLLQGLLLLALVFAGKDVETGSSLRDLGVVLLVLVLILPQQQLIPQLAHSLLVLYAHAHDVVSELGEFSGEGAVGHARLFFLHFRLVGLEERFVEGFDEGAQDVAQDKN